MHCCATTRWERRRGDNPKCAKRAKDGQHSDILIVEHNLTLKLPSLTLNHSVKYLVGVQYTHGSTTASPVQTATMIMAMTARPS
eukprot:scaffold22432_cov168-Amphora_coffeaeformis.AAC.6